MLTLLTSPNNELNIPDPKRHTGRSMPIPYYITADDACQLKSYLMKPIQHRKLTIKNVTYM